MGTAPSWAATVLIGQGQVSATANTVFTGAALTAASGTTIVTPGGSGSKVESIVFQATGTTIQGVLDIFLTTSGTNYRYDQVYVPVLTPSTTIAAFRYTKTYNNLWLPSGTTLVVASQVANQLISVNAFGGSF